MCLANGTVQCAGSATYQIWFRLPNLTLTLTRTLKVTKMYAVQNDTGIQFNTVICLGTGVGL